MKWCSLEECDDGWIKVQRADGPICKPCPACSEARKRAGSPGAFVATTKQADKYDLLARYRAALERIVEIADGTEYGLFANIARAALEE